MNGFNVTIEDCWKIERKNLKTNRTFLRFNSNHVLEKVFLRPSQKYYLTMVMKYMMNSNETHYYICLIYLSKNYKIKKYQLKMFFIQMETFSWMKNTQEIKSFSQHGHVGLFLH